MRAFSGAHSAQRTVTIAGDPGQGLTASGNPTTYEQARERFGEAGLIDAVVLLGNFGLTSLSLNIFQVPVSAERGWPIPDTTPDPHPAAAV